MPAASVAVKRAGDGRPRDGKALSGRARDPLDDDGTLSPPERRGPLAALRERLAP